MSIFRYIFCYNKPADFVPIHNNLLSDLNKSEMYMTVDDIIWYFGDKNISTQLVSSLFCDCPLFVD